MLRIAGELRLWQPDAVEELLREALALTDRLEPDPELRPIVLQQAAGLLAQKQCEIESVSLGVDGGRLLGR